MSIKDGGPAFPIPSEEMRLHGQSVAESQGMSLRDYFAAKAMQGVLSHPQGPAGKWNDAARDAYEMADAMLRAREVQS